MVKMLIINTNVEEPQKLYILQGIPGSGKSSLARKINYAERNSVICSTDDYFYSVNQGICKYEFNAKKLHEYHSKNIERAINYLDSKKTVIVDNTNIKRVHCFPYVQHAVKLEIPIIFIRVSSKYKSEHSVPEEIIKRMEQELENLTIESVLSCYQ